MGSEPYIRIRACQASVVREGHTDLSCHLFRSSWHQLHDTQCAGTGFRICHEGAFLARNRKAPLNRDIGATSMGNESIGVGDREPVIEVIPRPGIDHRLDGSFVPPPAKSDSCSDIPFYVVEI